MATPRSTAEHYRAQQALTVAAVIAARRAWRRMTADFDASWRSVLPLLALVLTAAQLRAARSARDYMTDVLDELDIDAPPTGHLVPERFAGVAADGRPLESLLYSPVARAKEARQRVTTPMVRRLELPSVDEALQAGEKRLVLIVQSEIADAERGATGVETVVRPTLRGHVRYLNPPSCGRCAILAGRFYRWSEGFRRHDNCDCRMIPVGDDIPDGLIGDPMDAYRKGQVHGLSEADRRAVDDGADLAQVVNVRRDSAGLKRAGRVLDRNGRPTPEAIYQATGDDRSAALALLRRHGYITD